MCKYVSVCVCICLYVYVYVSMYVYVYVYVSMYVYVCVYVRLSVCVCVVTEEKWRDREKKTLRSVIKRQTPNANRFPQDARLFFLFPYCEADGPQGSSRMVHPNRSESLASTCGSWSSNLGLCERGGCPTPTTTDRG